MSRNKKMLVFLAALFVAPAARAFTPWSGSPYEAQLLIDGAPATEYVHDGGNYVLGETGRRYAIRVVNHTGRRVEVVTSVDGLDAIDGKPADYVHRRGYVLQPWQTYEIEGFRLDFGRVATFRFASVAESYAAKKGDARNVGVIGVAFFPEREPEWRPPKPQPAIPYGGYGGYNGYGQFRGRGDADERSGGGAGSKAAGSAPQERVQSAPAAEASADATTSSPRDSGGEGRQGALGKRAEERPGLGTEFGEARESSVHQTSFVRASTTRPAATLAVRYNDRQGLVAMGVLLDLPPVAEAWMRHTANPFPANPPRNDFAAPPAGWRP